MNRAAPDGDDEQGSALIEFVWLGVLLLVPLVYVLIATFDVQRGAFGVDAASRAAGRAFTLADSVEDGRRQARSAASVALRDQGVMGEFELSIACDPGPCLSPGSVATVTVVAQVPMPFVPSALGGERPSFRVESVHRVPMGKYVERAQ